jgi:glycosyltransferase involved in cell wall biosynthesis
MMAKRSLEETPTGFDASQEPLVTNPPLRVCMHVLGTGRTDMRVVRSARALVDAGCHVSIVDVEHEDGRPACEQIDGVAFKHVPIASKWRRYYQPVSFLPWMAFKVMRIVRGIALVARTPADVYHAHDVTALPACYIAARSRRKLLIYDAHELPLVDPYHTRHRFVWSISARLLRFMLRRCSAIITVSPPIIGELQQRYGGPRARLVRSIPPYQSPSPTGRLREHLGLAADAGVALYQGNLQEDRRLDILIRAAHDLDPRHRIVLMGQDNMHGKLQDFIAQEGVGDRVTILPAVPYAELLEWTASADIGLVIFAADYSPTIRYCLPNKLFEYVLAGVPVLSAPLEAVAEVVRAHDLGIVLSSVEPSAVGAAINAMLDDKTALARMRLNALAAARNELNWESESRRLIEIYAESIRTTRSGRHRLAAAAKRAAALVED